MGAKAFDILGIAPTDDGRAIRAAFLRIARIYHPDRFVDGPEDVRMEAERRMKEATAAYELLRSANPVSTKSHGRFDEREVQQRAKKFRAEAEAKRLHDEHDRARWMRWDAAERRAREAADLESELAARIAEEVDDKGRPNGTVFESSEERKTVESGERTSRDSLGERLDAARRGETAPLVSQRAARR
jgi:curved DNA-binding protein CbpA